MLTPLLLLMVGLTVVGAFVLWVVCLVRLIRWRRYTRLGKVRTVALFFAAWSVGALQDLILKETTTLHHPYAIESSLLVLLVAVAILVFMPSCTTETKTATDHVAHQP